MAELLTMASSLWGNNKITIKEGEKDSRDIAILSEQKINTKNTDQRKQDDA